MRLIARIAAVAAFALLHIGASSAAELKVFCTIGVQAAMERLVPSFESASGDKLAITFGTAAILVKKVQAGETADVLILTRQGLDELVGAGRATRGADSDFASSGMSMVVRKDAPRPDISTPEAFRQTLLAAKTIAYSDPAFGGASGVYFAKLLERMGIAAHLLVATNGRQALDLLYEHCPEPGAPTCPVLILLDINMPVMNGFEFLEAYAQLPPVRRAASVVLMLTTSLNPRDAERLRNLPAAGSIVKPLSRAKVARLLHEHFDHPLPGT